MRKSNVNYGQLDSVLRSLGFVVRVEKGKRRLYSHEATGALMSLPDRKPGESANATYLAAVRKVLADYEIADEIEFASQLKRPVDLWNSRRYRRNLID